MATKGSSIFKPPEERRDGEECKDGGPKKKIISADRERWTETAEEAQP